MKNKEKYVKEIAEIACEGAGVAVSEETGKPVQCVNIRCSRCAFLSKSRYKTCIDHRKAWAEYLSVNIQYIARDMSGRLYIYVRKPYKQIDCWSSSACETEKPLWMFNVDFPMVKWSDEEPWLIENLKKLEAVEEYE